MADVTYRFHLNFPECSGLAVQFKILSDSEIRAAQLAVMKSVQKDATVFEVREREKRESLKRMITHVSDGPAQPPIDDSTKFIPVTLQDFELPLGPMYFEKVFSRPKDVAVLERLYSKFHELSLDEAQSIEGKLIPVSLG